MPAHDDRQPVVLVLDDEKNIRNAIEIALDQEGMHVIGAHDVAAALRTLHERIVDVMIVDIRLGEVERTRVLPPRAGRWHRATDYLHLRPRHAHRGGAGGEARAASISSRSRSAPKRSRSRCSAASRCRACASACAWPKRARTTREIVGDSAVIRRLVQDAIKVARTSASVLITGESGTGKELVANCIHAHSDRAQQPFVKVNCSAIPENLIESELFGHERGAFTGAIAARKGLFEVAHRGVIFLDEIADLAASAQAKILRVLQSGEIQRVGAERPTVVDVRVLSGTHKDLKAAVAEGRFREDLFYRLNVVPLRVPALRERLEDLPLLVQFLMRRLGERNNLREKPIDDEVFDELKRHDWPGNVRELQNVLERLMIMSGERITTLDLPEEILAALAQRDGARRSRRSRNSAIAPSASTSWRRCGGSTAM